MKCFWVNEESSRSTAQEAVQRVRARQSYKIAQQNNWKSASLFGVAGEQNALAKQKSLLAALAETPEQPKQGGNSSSAPVASDEMAIERDDEGKMDAPSDETEPDNEQEDDSMSRLEDNLKSRLGRGASGSSLV